ncbi:uncharacterized protein LOC126899647 [Daktulosphaira vitifoliae]|uniref:uncharacterized protein LOC126899647 n=1 Tax=Daktulosphaira vitifoliae TaxID=58002 RepID=UPI0021AA30F7|nr:uncharacterized protein LOC126899647 [Daktulosphaira vitifoliae]
MACSSVLLLGVITFAVIVSTEVDCAPSDWLADANSAIKDSLAKVSTYGVEDGKVKEIVNKGFEDFASFTKDGINKLLAKVEQNEAMKSKLNVWLKEVDDIRNSKNGVEETGKTALKKFEETIDYIAEEAVSYKKDVETNPNEEILKEAGGLIRSTTNKLVENMKSIESQIQAVKVA